MRGLSGFAVAGNAKTTIFQGVHVAYEAFFPFVFVGDMHDQTESESEAGESSHACHHSRRSML